jgi:hypothetical protein
MMDNNLSPEQILKQKELIGGISFDDQIADLAPTTIPEDRIEKEVESLRKNSLHPNTSPSDSPLANEFKKAKEEIPSLEPPSVMSIGWKNLPLAILPSAGMFYPEGTQIAIRSAEVKEIKHFSMIDESDMLDIEQKLNMILNSCCVIKFPSQGVVNYKDLKQEDRFFVIMAIRDLTFIKGENRIILQPRVNCGKTNCSYQYGIELRTGVLSKYELEKNIMEYYSKQERKFVLPVPKLSKTLRMTIPSIGVIDTISSFARNRIRSGQDVDESFIKIAPFIFDDWRDLTEKKILEMEQDSLSWSKEEFSIYFELANKIKIGTKLEVNLPCETCGAQEVTAQISFPGGFRSLFVISDIFRELL